MQAISDWSEEVSQSLYYVHQTRISHVKLQFGNRDGPRVRALLWGPKLRKVMQFVLYKFYIHAKLCSPAKLPTTNTRYIISIMMILIQTLYSLCCRNSKSAAYVIHDISQIRDD